MVVAVALNRREEPMIRSALIALALSLCVLPARAQDAPPIPSGFICDANPDYSNTQLLSCEGENQDLALTSIGSMYWNDYPCYLGIYANTLIRNWYDSTVAIVGSSLRYAYEVGVFVGGQNSGYPPASAYGHLPCLWNLPVLINPASSVQDKEYIAETNSLSCRPGEIVEDSSIFACHCPAGQAWNGYPWPGVQDQYVQSCTEPPVTQDGANVPFTIACSNGTCAMDNRMTFALTKGYPFVNVAYPTGGYVDTTNSYVTVGCCQNAQVTWQAVDPGGPLHHPPVGVRALVPVVATSGTFIQAHVVFKLRNTAQTSATWYGGASTCTNCPAARRAP